MYTAALVAGLFYVLAGRPAAALVAFGVSASLKPHAIFFCPFLAGLILRGGHCLEKTLGAGRHLRRLRRSSNAGRTCHPPDAGTLDDGGGLWRGPDPRRHQLVPMGF